MIGVRVDTLECKGISLELQPDCAILSFILLTISKLNPSPRILRQFSVTNISEAFTNMKDQVQQTLLLTVARQESDLSFIRQDLIVVTRNIDEIRGMPCSFLQYSQNKAENYQVFPTNGIPNLCALGAEGPSQGYFARGGRAFRGILNKSMEGVPIGGPLSAVVANPMPGLLTKTPLFLSRGGGEPAHR
ncbi:hypothetical protein EJ110_NYTH53467 [Nymphaea thermarum]|nr:hypothetical protein EJ110_NYTH53467 [Nymphaea thermarum]